MIHHGITFPADQLATFCRRHHVQRLSLFGSVLRRDFRPDSDVDILIEFAPEARVGLAFFQMEEELSKLLGRKVDLNTPGFLSPAFREEVMRHKEVQYDASR
ncbi:MAG: nucleotidyltransferase family protein [Gemmataceae bacterium]